MLYQRSNVFDRVVRGRVKFVDVVGSGLVEAFARIAVVAGFHFWSWGHAVDRFGENACASGLANSTRAAKKICVRKMLVGYCVFECIGD